MYLGSRGRKTDRAFSNQCTVKAAVPKLQQDKDLHEHLPYLCVTVFPWMGMNKGKRYGAMQVETSRQI